MNNATTTIATTNTNAIVDMETRINWLQKAFTDMSIVLSVIDKNATETVATPDVIDAYIDAMDYIDIFATAYAAAAKFIAERRNTISGCRNKDTLHEYANFVRNGDKHSLAKFIEAAVANMDYETADVDMFDIIHLIDDSNNPETRRINNLLDNLVANYIAYLYDNKIEKIGINPGAEYQIHISEIADAAVLLFRK